MSISLKTIEALGLLGLLTTGTVALKVLIERVVSALDRHPPTVFTESEQVVMVDPPSGHRYGFPREVPREIARDMTGEEFRQWLVECGYPEEDLELAMKYSRYWFQPRGSVDG